MFVSRDNVAVGDAHSLQSEMGKNLFIFFVSFKWKTIFRSRRLIPHHLNLNEAAESPLSRHIFKN